MSDTARWVIAVVMLLLVVGIIAYARGDEHYRGDEVGALDARANVTTVI
ncbi:MAG TPA: hypothetical protein VIV08_03125 [Acidimicrobiia bacterium]